MANKYLIHGATFDGDGTTSSPAASAGAAGAWNSFPNVLNNSLTYGSYTAGDTIYCATNDGTADIGYTQATNINTAIFEAPDQTVTLVFDDGTNVGSAGTFTLTKPTSPFYVFENQGWHIIGNNRFVIDNNRTTVTDVLENGGIMQDFEIQQAGSWPPIRSTNNRKTILRGLTVKIPASSTTSTPLFIAANGAMPELIDIVLDFTSNPMTNLGPLFDPENSQGGSLIVRGFRVINDSSTAFEWFLQNDPSTGTTGTPRFIDMSGINVGSHYRASDLSPPPINKSGQRYRNGYLAIKGTLAGTGVHDTVWAMHHGYVSWMQGLNYPYLNAILPDNTTNWSYQIFPRFVYEYNPIECPPLLKLFEDTAATKTITVELLVEDTVTNINDWYVWIEVDYINNANDQMVTETTRVAEEVSATTLTTSTAGWNTTTYGALSYDKYKIELTTANSIKTDTEIVVRLFVGANVNSDTKFWFYDPDFGIS